MASYWNQCESQPLNWWPFYRTAWCYNLLDLPDSALVYARTALAIHPANQRCLAELLKSLSDQPEAVLEYSYLVCGGGTCRYRLARAEMDLNIPDKLSLNWLENSFVSEIDSIAADAGCWLSILHGDSGLEYIERSVELMPEEEFYRSLLIGKLLDVGMVERASLHFEILKEAGYGGYSFWQTASQVHESLGDSQGAIEASRRAYQLRRIPSTAADLGWKLYFYGRALMRNGDMMVSVPYFRESSSLWSGDSLWAIKSDSLLDLMNEFTSTSEGYGEPI